MRAPLHPLLCAALALLALLPGVASAAPQTGGELFVRSVRTVRAETGTLTVTRSATATIEPARESRVSAATTGQVARIAAREGSRVAAGEVVVYLDDEALRLNRDNAALAVESARINLQSAERASASGDAQAQAALQAARAGLEAAREAYEAGAALFEAGGLARSELTQLRVQLEQAEASYLQAKGTAEASRLAPSEDLELLRLQLEQAQTQLRQAEAALRDAELRAPFSGEIAELLVEEGEFIGAGSPAFRVVGTEGRLARFDVPPRTRRGFWKRGSSGSPTAASTTRRAPCAPRRPKGGASSPWSPRSTPRKRPSRRGP